MSQPLSKEDISELLQVIRDRFQLVAAQIQGDYQPPQDLLSRWQAEGWIAPDVTPQDFALAVGTEGRIIHNAFTFGRAWQAVEQGGSFAEIMKLAATMPLLTPDVHAIAIAEQQTANYITALGDDTAKLAGEIIAERNRTIIRNMAIDFHEQRLQAKVLDRQAKIDAGIAIPERQVNTWQGFSSELYHAMDDKSRDWDRVAFFEITDAQKQGQAMQILEQHGPKQLVYKMPLPTACAQCKHLYLEEDGTPRIFDLAELVGNGMNIGRKAHPVRSGEVVPGGREDGQETLKAVAGLIHPWCACLGPFPFTGYEPWYLQKKNRGNATIAKSHQKTVCVDFDGVIADYSQGFKGEDVFGHPLTGAADVTHRMHDKGWKVIIFTTRRETHGLRSYLERNGIWYDSINTNSDQPEGSNAGKPIADAYLDDRAIRFSDWQQAERDLMRLVKSEGNVLLKSHVKTYTRKDGTIVREHDDSRSKKAQPAPTGHHHALVALLRKRKVATGDGKKPKGRIGHPMALLRTVAKKKVEPGKETSKLGPDLFGKGDGDMAVKSPLKVFGGNSDHSSGEASLEAERKNYGKLVDLAVAHNVKRAGIEDVAIKDLHSLQTTVGKNKAAQMAKEYDDKKAKEEPPVVYRTPDGKLILKDGNHRAVGALMAGRTHIKAEVFDLEKPKATAAATRKRIEAEIRGGEPRTVLGETHYVKVLAKARREEDEIVDYFNSDLIKSEEKRDAHGRFSRTEESARHDAKLRRLYGQAAGKENHPIEGHVIRSVTREEAEKIRRLTGISVDNYRFGVTNTGLRHVHKEHGNETVEAQANQVAIKEHDIQRIPDIISRPKVIRRAHDTPQGNKTISFEKEYTDGTEVYIVEVIARSSLLHVKTMFKKKP